VVTAERDDAHSKFGAAYAAYAALQTQATSTGAELSQARTALHDAETRSRQAQSDVAAQQAQEIKSLI
jgi:hypothetical protein